MKTSSSYLANQVSWARGVVCNVLFASKRFRQNNNTLEAASSEFSHFNIGHRGRVPSVHAIKNGHVILIQFQQFKQ